MQIQIKLMGMLKEKMPEGGKLEVVDGATISDVLSVLDVPAESVQVFTVNGQLERDKSRELSADDELSVLPPVGGG